MNNNFTFGSYVPGSSYMYRIDPRVKILSTILLMVMCFFVKNIYVMLGILGAVVIIFLSARLNIFKAIAGLRHLFMLSIFIFIFQILFNQTGELMYEGYLNFSILSIGVALSVLLIYIFTKRYIKFKSLYLLVMFASLIVSFTFIPGLPNNFYILTYKIFTDGFNTAIFVLLRLVVVMLIAMILTLTTKPNDLTLALEWIFRPLKIFKINSEEIALIFTIALRYIPTILDEAYKIMDAQASRGADFKEGSIGRKISQVVSLLVPMFIISFSRSNELADAMLSRNFVPGKPKTRYHILKFRPLDLVSSIFVILLSGGILCLYILL